MNGEKKKKHVPSNVQGFFKNDGSQKQEKDKKEEEEGKRDQKDQEKEKKNEHAGEREKKSGQREKRETKKKMQKIDYGRRQKEERSRRETQKKNNATEQRPIYDRGFQNDDAVAKLSGKQINGSSKFVSSTKKESCLKKKVEKIVSRMLQRIKKIEKGQSWLKNKVKAFPRTRRKAGIKIDRPAMRKKKKRAKRLSRLS